MRSIIEECGQNAGKIWEALDEYGPLIEPKLMKYTRLTQKRRELPENRFRKNKRGRTP